MFSQKAADLFLFKKVLDLMNIKAHLNKEGLLKIVNIKASMNLAGGAIAPPDLQNLLLIFLMFLQLKDQL